MVVKIVHPVINTLLSTLEISYLNTLEISYCLHALVQLFTMKADATSAVLNSTWFPTVQLTFLVKQCLKASVQVHSPPKSVFIKFFVVFNF